MGRIRTIKPEFPQSESMGRVSRDARLLFIQLWTLADDSGRTRAAPRMLSGLLFPYDPDAAGLIGGWLAELAREGCVLRYAVDGGHYLQICNWTTHQKIDRPSGSRFPAPPAEAAAGAATSAVPPAASGPAASTPQARDASRRIREGTMDQGSGLGPGPEAPVAAAGAPPGLASPDLAPPDIATPDVATPDRATPDLATLVFGVGLDWLRQRSGQSERACRALLGKWRRDHGDEALISALGAGQREGPIDAVAWLERALRGGRGGAARAGGPGAAGASLPATDPWDRRVAEFRNDIAAGRAAPQTFWARTMSRHWGPPPGDPACQAPPAVLARHGFAG